MAEIPDRLTDALAGRYRIERLLGSGGMADVFLAQDLKHSRRGAIKVLKPELAALLGRERFLREIELAARLQHPYILALWDSGVAGDLLYYVMPYLEGDTLRQRLEREKQLPLEDAVRIASEVAEALDYSHKRDLVHRDIKPENILLQEGHAIVADFGIARAVGLSGGTRLTETGVTLGTPAYMSTEQALGGRELDGRSDQYSLACVTYEMLAGQPPFTGATAESVVHQHVAAQPRPVTDLRAAVPASVAAALTRALAKAPADRYASTGEFARALKTAAAASPTSEVATTRVTSRERQRRLALAVAGLVLTVAALFTWWWIEFRGRAAVADPSKKDLILVARFEGPADDPELAPTVRNMISAAIDQSGIVATVSDEDLRQGLRNAGKPESTKVDAALARELAYRRSIRGVLECQVGRLGTGYSVTARLVDVENNRLLLSASESAPNQQRLIPALQKLGQRLRVALGEQRAALRATRPLHDVATPDFEAYRLYTRGQEATARADFDLAGRLMRAAIDRDPAFGSAWRSFGICLGNLSGTDSLQWALEQALRCTGRLSEFERLNIEGILASSRRDLPAWLDATEEALRTNMTPGELGIGLLWRGHALGTAGRYEEQCESYRLAIEASVSRPSQIVLSRLFSGLVALGRFDEARGIAERMRWRNEFLARLEVSRDGWPAAESIGTSVAADAAADLWDRITGAISAASGSAARGRVARAARVLGEIRRTAESTGDGRVARFAGDQECTLAIFAGRGVLLDASTSAFDTTFDGVISRMFRTVVAGRNELAAAGISRLVADPRSRRPEYAVATGVLQGWSARVTGRDHEAMALLRPIALQTGWSSYAWWPDILWRQQARWLLADVYERSGRPDSAAVSLELLLAPAGRYHAEMPWRGFYFSFAHQRLVLLYARMGQLEPARRHWEAFSKAFDDPDPELRPLVVEARNALAAAEAMAKGTQR